MINCLLEARVRGHDTLENLWLSAQLIGCEFVNPLSEPLLFSLRGEIVVFCHNARLAEARGGRIVFCETGPAEMLGI
jgi:hypothetical protein